MTIKKMQCLVLFLAFAASLAFSAEAPTVAFKAGDIYLSPQLVGVSAGSAGKFALGPNVEYFLSKTVAVGGDVSIYLVSPGGLSLFPDIEYHFNVNVRGLDVFAGPGPSLFVGFGSEGKTLFGGKAFGAARYFFTPSTGVFLKLGIASSILWLPRIETAEKRGGRPDVPGSGGRTAIAEALRAYKEPRRLVRAD